MSVNPYQMAAAYVRDGHDLDQVAARFAVAPDRLRIYVDESSISDTSLRPVSEENRPVTRHSDTSDTSDTDSQNPDLLAGVRSGSWLHAQQFPPLRYAIPDVIPEGFTLLVGPPKAGKSYLALGVLLAKSSGGMALGRIPVGEPARVLYVALEDGDRRMQARCRDLLAVPYRPDEPIPERFHYLTRVMPGMIVPTVEAFCDTYPDTALVVVDTLGKVMPPAAPNETSYGRDYRVGGRLKAIADLRPGLALTALHHDRKAYSDDFVERVSGTNGLAGAADTVIVLARKRQSTDGLLQITGRDVPEGEFALTMGSSGMWTLDGDSLAEAAETARRRAAENALSDQTADIWAFVREGGLAGVARKEVAQKFGANADKYLSRLVEAGRIERAGRGRYRDTSIPLSEVSEVSETQVTAPIEFLTPEEEVSETDVRGDAPEEGTLE